MESEKKISKDKKETVESRKYLNYVLAMVAVVLVAFIGSRLYGTYKENKLGESVFSRMVGNIQYGDIESTINELPSHGFILISYTKNEDTKKLEKNLKKTIIANELQNNFLYLDATELRLEEDYIDTLNEKFHLEGRYVIEEIPAIIYYKDGVVQKTIGSTKDRMLTADDFDKLLDNYEVLNDNVQQSESNKDK